MVFVNVYLTNRGSKKITCSSIVSLIWKIIKWIPLVLARQHTKQQYCWHKTSPVCDVLLYHGVLLQANGHDRKVPRFFPSCTVSSRPLVPWVINLWLTHTCYSILMHMLFSPICLPTSYSHVHTICVCCSLPLLLFISTSKLKHSAKLQAKKQDYYKEYICVHRTSLEGKEHHRKFWTEWAQKQHIPEDRREPKAADNQLTSSSNDSPGNKTNMSLSSMTNLQSSKTKSLHINQSMKNNMYNSTDPTEADVLITLTTFSIHIYWWMDRL